MTTPTAEAGRTAEIDEVVVCLFSMVVDRLRRATVAFLEQDRAAATRLIAGDGEFDTLQDEVEDLVEAELANNSGAAALPFLLSVLRIVPELERSGDLVEHIALRTATGVVAELTPVARTLIADMASLGVELWDEAAKAYVRRDPTAADRLRGRDDELDDLHVRLTAELAAGSLSPAVAIELGLVARFYERLGDHAVNVTRRVRGVVAADRA